MKDSMAIYERDGANEREGICRGWVVVYYETLYGEILDRPCDNISDDSIFAAEIICNLSLFKPELGCQLASLEIRNYIPRMRTKN